MRTSMRCQLLIAAVAVTVVVVGAALTVVGWPRFVITHGASMEPGFRQGDLAVIRQADTYGVGDVVAYRSRLLDTTVMHRIVGRDGDRYVFKGDNNTWLDRDRPTRDELIGVQQLRLPGVGSGLAWARSSWPVPLGVAVLLMGLGATRRADKRLRHRKLGTPMRERTNGSSTGGWVRLPSGLLPVVAAALAGFVALGALAFARPAQVPAGVDVRYEQRGSFTYSAPAPAGPVYDADLSTGDPVFLSLLDAVDVRFEYELDAVLPVTASGTIALSAELADASGWTRQVPLSRPTAFDGSSGVLTETLDLDRMRDLIDEVEGLTGVHSGTYALAVVADVEVDGRLAGRDLTETFAARMEFHLDALRLRPAWAATEQRPGALVSSEGGSVASSRSAPGHLSALGRQVEVGHARLAALAGTVVTAALLAAAAFGLRSRRGDEVARIGLRHGHRIVHVVAGEGGGDAAVIDVTTMSDLARIADQYGCLILHNQHAGTHSYVFQVDRTLYRYRVRGTVADAS